MPCAPQKGDSPPSPQKPPRYNNRPRRWCLSPFFNLMAADSDEFHTADGSSDGGPRGVRSFAAPTRNHDRRPPDRPSHPGPAAPSPRASQTAAIVQSVNACVVLRYCFYARRTTKVKKTFQNIVAKNAALDLSRNRPAACDFKKFSRANSAAAPHSFRDTRGR